MYVEIHGNQLQTVEQIEYLRFFINRNRKIDEEIRISINTAN